MPPKTVEVMRASSQNVGCVGYNATAQLTLLNGWDVAPFGSRTRKQYAKRPLLPLVRPESQKNRDARYGLTHEHHRVFSRAKSFRDTARIHFVDSAWPYDFFWLEDVFAEFPERRREDEVVP